MNHCQPDVDHNLGDCDLCDYYEDRLQNRSLKYPAPHCDAYVLHAPGNCETCDDYASDMQQWRQKNGVNFTEEADLNKKPCPATIRRKPDTIHAWYGNVPLPKSCPKCGLKATYINLALACPKHGPV